MYMPEVYRCYTIDSEQLDLTRAAEVRLTVERGPREKPGVPTLFAPSGLEQRGTDATWDLGLRCSPCHARLW